MRRHIRRTRNRFFKRHLWKTRFVFWFGAALVGIIASLFAYLADIADTLFREVIDFNPYLPFLITPIGLLAIVYVTRNLFDGASGSGVPQTYVAIETNDDNLRHRIMSLRNAVGRFFLVLFGLLCGASIGRIGPSIQIGAAIMYNLGRFTNNPGRYFERGLMIAGGGAGLAAGFNAPIAGVMFAFEEMAKWFDRRQISLILISVIIAGMVAIIFHHSNYNYRNLDIRIEDSMLWLAVVVCGITGGVAGGLFSRLLIVMTRWLGKYSNRYWVLITLSCGLIIATTGFLSDGAAHGSGYHETTALVTCTASEACDIELGLMYPVYKFIATAAALLAGIPAGIFIPTLATGAGIGNDIAMLFPTALTSTIIILGMIAYFSSVMQTPITAFIVVIEMTSNHDLVLAMMATSLVATGVSRLLCERSLFTTLAENVIANLKQSNR